MENNNNEYNFNLNEADLEETRINEEEYLQYEEEEEYRKALAVSDVEQAVKRVSGDITGDPFSYIQKAARSGEIKFGNDGSLTLNSRNLIKRASLQEIKNLENPLPNYKRRYSSTFNQVKDTGGFISRPKVEDYQSILEIDETFRGSFFQIQQRDILKSLLSREKRTEIAYQEADITSRQKQSQTEQEEQNRQVRASILSPNNITETIISNRTDNKTNVLLNPITSKGSFHPKIGVIGDTAIVGTQNLTPALSKNKSIESLLVFKKDSQNPVSVGSVVVDEINQTLDSIFQGKKQPLNNTSLKSRNIDDNPLIKTKGYIYTNEDILVRIKSALDTAAESKTDKVVISMGEISLLLYGDNDPTGLKTSLEKLAKNKQLTLVTDSNRLNQQATKDKSTLNFINRLQEVSEGTAVTTAVTTYLHDKSIGIFDKDNNLQFLSVGSANFSKSSLVATENGRPINTELIAAIGTGNYVDKNRALQNSQQANNYLNTLTKTGSVITHFNALSRGSLENTNLYNTGYLAERTANVDNVEALKNELLNLNKTFAGESNTDLIKVTDRLGTNKSKDGKFQTVGLSVEINGLGGLHRTTINLTVNDEGNIILTNNNKILGKSLFVNKSDSNKNVFGVDLDPGSSKVLTAQETAVSFVSTIARELSYQGTKSLVNSVYMNMYHKDRNNEIAGKAASSWLASVFNQVDPNIVVKGTEVGSSITPNFGSLAHFLSQDPNDMLKTTSAVIKNIAEGKFTGGNQNLTQEQISERFNLLDVAFRNFDNPQYENSAAYNVSQNIVHLLANDSTGLLTDVKLSLLREDPEFSKVLKQAAITQSKEIVNLLAAPFLAAHESTYSAYQAQSRLPIFGSTEGSKGDTIYDRVVEAGLLDPITVRHGTKIGNAGQFVRLVSSTAYQTNAKLPGYGGLRQLKTVDSDISTGAAVVNETEVVYRSTPNLVTITQEGQRDNINKMLSARKLDLSEKEQEELDKRLENRLSTNLYYQPFPKAEQIPQRLKNVFGQRPAVSFDQSKIKAARNMGLVDVENSEDILGGRLREVIPAEQYAEVAALKEQLQKEGKSVTYEDLQKIYREKEASPHTTKRGFIGPERMKRVLLNAGISTMGDFSYGNAGYEEATGSLSTFKIKVNEDALINSTETQQILAKALKPGAIATYTDLTVSDQTAVNKIISTYSLDGINTSSLAINTITNLNELSITNTNESTDSIALLKQQARKYNELLKASDKEGSKDIVFRVEDGQLVATYKAGLYSPNDEGILVKVGEFEEKGMLRIKGLNKQKDTPTGKRLEPINIKLPTFNKRFESGISVIAGPISLTISQGSLLVEGTVATAHKPGSGSRPTGPVKGPIEYIRPKLFDDAKKKRENANYQSYVPNAIKNEDYYSLQLFSLYKGFPADSGLYLLSQEDTRANLSNASGEEIAKSLSLLFLGDKEIKQALRMNLNASGDGQISAALKNVKGIDISKKSVHGDANLGHAALGLLMLADDAGIKEGVKEFGLEPVKEIVRKALGTGQEAEKARETLKNNADSLFKLIDENSIQFEDGKRIISEGDTLNRGGGLLAHAMFFGKQLFNITKIESMGGLYERDLSDVVQYRNNESYKQVVDLMALALDIELDQTDDRVLGRQLKMLQAFQQNDVVLEGIVDTTVSQSLVPAGMKDDVRLEFQYLVGMSSKYLKAFEPIGGAGEDSQSVQQALMLISSAIKGGLSDEQKLSYKLAVVGEGEYSITKDDIRLKRFLLTNNAIAKRENLSDSFIDAYLIKSTDAESQKDRENVLDEKLNKIERIYQETTTIEDTDNRIRGLNLSSEFGVGYFSEEIDDANEKQLEDISNILKNKQGVTDIESLDEHNKNLDAKVKAEEGIKKLNEDSIKLPQEIATLESMLKRIPKNTEKHNKISQQIKDKKNQLKDIPKRITEEETKIKDVEKSIAEKVPKAFDVVNSSLLTAFQSYQDYVSEQKRAYQLSMSFADYIDKSTNPELSSFQKLNQNYNIIADITDKEGNLKGRINTALAKSNRRVLEGIEETINRSAADTYLENVLNLEAEIIKRKQAQETTLETKAHLELRLKDLQSSKQIVLPHYRVEAVTEGENEGLYRVKVYSPEDVAPTIGVLLGTDILRNTSLVFGDYKDDLLTKQVELVEKLYQLEELTNRVFTDPDVDAVITAETVQQLDSLRDSIEASRLALVQQLDTNVVRKAFGDQQNYRGATGIATASFGLDNDQVIVGKRFSDWQSGEIQPQELLLNQLRLVQASNADGASEDVKKQHIDNLITIANQFRSTESLESNEKVKSIKSLPELEEQRSLKETEREKLTEEKRVKENERKALTTKSAKEEINRKIKDLEEEQVNLGKKGSDEDKRKAEIAEEIKKLQQDLDELNPKNINNPVNTRRRKLKKEISKLDNQIKVVETEVNNLNTRINESNNAVQRGESEESVSTKNLRNFLDTYGSGNNTSKNNALTQVYSYMTGLPMNAVNDMLNENDGLKKLNELLTVAGKSGVRRSGAPAGAGALVANNISYELKTPQSINNNFAESGERVSLLEIDNERFATGMKVPAMSRLLAGLGDYDGDTYQILMNRMSSTSQGILGVQNEIISKQAQLEEVNTLLEYRRNITADKKNEIIQEQYERYVNSLDVEKQKNINKDVELQKLNEDFDNYTQKLEGIKQTRQTEISELTNSLDEKIRNRSDNYELDGALKDKAMNDVRSFVKNQLSLPDILTGDFEGGKQMSTGQVVGILQQKFDMGQIADNKAFVQQAEKNIEIFGKLFDKEEGGLDFSEELLEEENLGKLKDHLLKQNADKDLDDKEVMSDLQDMASFMRGKVTADSYDSIMTEYFTRTANIGAAFEGLSGSFKKATGTVLNPFEFEGLTGLIGKGGSELLGKAYNAFIPLLDQALIDSSIASGIKVSPDFQESLRQSLGEDSELYQKVTSDEFTDSLNKRYHGITGFLGGMQQMVRDALKAKEGGNIQELLNKPMEDGKTLGELLESYDDTKTAAENDLAKVDLLKTVLTTNIGSTITLADDPFIANKGTDSQVYKSRESTYQRIDPKMTGFGALLMFSEYTMTSDDQIDARFFSDEGYGLQEDYDKAVAARTAAGEDTPLSKTQFLSSYIQGLIERTQASFSKDSVIQGRGGVNAMVSNALDFHNQKNPDSLEGYDRKRYDLVTEYNELVKNKIDAEGIDADLDPLKNRLIEELVLTKIQEDNEKYGVFSEDSISYLRDTALARSALDLGDTSTEGEVNNRLLEANNLGYNAYIRRLRRGQQTDAAEASFISSNKLSVINNALSELGVDPENLSPAQQESLLLIAGLRPGGSLLDSDEQAELSKALLRNTTHADGRTTTPLNQLQESSAGVAKMTGYLNILNDLYERGAPQSEINVVTDQLRMFYSDAGINVDTPQKLHRIINQQQQQLNITQTQQKLNQTTNKQTLNNADQGIYKGITINHGAGLGLLAAVVSPLVYAGLSEGLDLDDRVYSAGIDIMQSVAQTVSDDTRLTTQLSAQNESVAAKMKYSRIRRNLKMEGMVIGGIQSVAQESLNMAFSKSAYAAIDYVNRKTAITGQMSSGRAAATVGAEILSTVLSQGLSRTLTGGRASAEGGYVIDPITRLVKQYAEQIWQMVEEAQEAMLDSTQEVLDTDENQNIDFDVSAFPGVFEWDVESGVIVLDQDSNPIPMELESSSSEQVELLQTVQTG